ncbi:MAG: patatin-like phospholipase family protein [Acidobacteria bacterium]|nr:patatin-like phospholipase family protein [Acidobacteriota bacterium]
MVISLLACAQDNRTPPSPDAQSTTQSTTHAATKRLKIGVALQGGGALGLAHIGVRQWFEDHHIPIDYIAGTSMGGLVGGLYATGKSPEDLQEIVEKQKWEPIIGGRTPYDDLSFRRKEDQRALPNYLIVGLRRGPVVPRRGYTVDANFHWYDSYPESATAFPAGDATISGLLPITRDGSLFATFNGGTTFGHDSGGFPLYFLGGPTHLSAYGTNELFGDQFYLVRTGSCTNC